MISVHLIGDTGADLATYQIAEGQSLDVPIPFERLVVVRITNHAPEPVPTCASPDHELVDELRRLVCEGAEPSDG